jgi:hypothetical protein
MLFWVVDEQAQNGKGAIVPVVVVVESRISSDHAPVSRVAADQEMSRFRFVRASKYQPCSVQRHSAAVM